MRRLQSRVRYFKWFKADAMKLKRASRAADPVRTRRFFKYAKVLPYRSYVPQWWVDGGIALDKVWGWRSWYMDRLNRRKRG